MKINELKSQSRWLLWKKEDGKKIPYYTSGKRRGSPDTELDASQLVPFKQAKSDFNKSYSGIGIAINDGLIGIDLDKCYDKQGHLIAQAKSLVSLFDSYTEISPSENGLHVLCEGIAPVGHKSRPIHCGYEYEFYSQKRFFTFTEKQLENTSEEIKTIPPHLIEGQFIGSKCEQKTPSPVTQEPAKNNKTNTRRALKALEQACHAVENAKRGGGGFDTDESRSDSINKYGYLVGRFIGGGLLDEKESKGKLRKAALANQDPLEDKDIKRQIIKAIREGKNNPVTKEWLDQTNTAKSNKEVARPLFEINTLGTFKDKVKPIEWLIDGVLESNTLSLMFGEPGCGKSFIAVDLASSVASGEDWHGKAIKAPGCVVYIAGEGFSGIARRFDAWSAYNKVTDSKSIVTSNRAADLHNPTGAEAVADELEQLDMSPQLIIVDTLARNFGCGDENSTSDMSTFINNIDLHLRHRFNCCVLLVHHTGHSSKDRGRGSSVLKGALDVEYKVVKTQDSILLSNTKMKDAELAQPICFNLEPVVLDFFGNDDCSSAVLVSGEIKDFEDNQKSRITGARQKQILKIVDDEITMPIDELQGILRDEGVDKDNARNSIKRLIAKGVLIDDNGSLSVSDKVSYCLPLHSR